MRPALAIDRTPPDAANRPEAKSNASGKGTADETCVHNSVYALRRNHGPRTIDQLFAFACNPYPTCRGGTKPNSIIQASDGN